MIKNERQYRATTSAIERFEHALASRADEPPADSGIHPMVWRAEGQAIEGELQQLRESASYYEALKTGTERVHAITSWSDVPRALIEGRIASNLTQKELAERLGIPEQQLQRYEATDYASASLTRIRETAEALSLELAGIVIPSGVEISAPRFFDRIADLGIDRRWLLDRLVPGVVAEVLANVTRKSKSAATAALVQAAEIVSRVFDVSVYALFGEQSLSFTSQLARQTRYKRVRKAGASSQNAWSLAYTSYAYFIAKCVVRATTHLGDSPLPSQSAQWRSALKRRGQILNLESAVRFFWQHGVPVIPLSDAGTFHGACWRLEDGQEVIILKQRSMSADRWLGDLLHEGGHIVQEPGQEPFMVIEHSENPSITDERERAATEFAADIMLDGRAEVLAEQALRAADGNIPFLKRTVPVVAQQAGVPTGALAYFMAFYIARETQGKANWWGTAQALQSRDNNPWRITRDILLENVDLDRLNGVERDVVVRALSEAPSGSSQ